MCAGPALYRTLLDSTVADIANVTGDRHGGAITAALFLREFVPADIAWANLDIYGSAFCDTDDGERVAGGTGFGVRTLVELLLKPEDVQAAVHV